MASEYFVHFSVTLHTSLFARPVEQVSKGLRLWTNAECYRRNFTTKGVVLSKSSIDQVINENISAGNVLLIDQNGENLGLKSKDEALAIARENLLQLVEVQKPTNGHSVCRLFTSKALIKDQIKKKKNESKTHASKVKELVVGAMIAPQDLEWKIKKVWGWLDERHQVKLCITHKHWQKVTEADKMKIIQQVVEAMKDVGELDGKPKQGGPLMIKWMFKPTHKK